MNGYAIDSYDPKRDDFYQLGRIYWDENKVVLHGNVRPLWVEFLASVNGDAKAAYAAIPRRLFGNTYLNVRKVTDTDTRGNDGEGLLEAQAKEQESS